MAFPGNSPKRRARSVVRGPLVLVFLGLVVAVLFLNQALTALHSGTHTSKPALRLASLTSGGGEQQDTEAGFIREEARSVVVAVADGHRLPVDVDGSFPFNKSLFVPFVTDSELNWEKIHRVSSSRDTNFERVTRLLFGRSFLCDELTSASSIHSIVACMFACIYAC
jgi:hypothetical protein